MGHRHRVGGRSWGEAYLDMVKGPNVRAAKYKEQMQSLQQMSFSMDQARPGHGRRGTLPLGAGGRHAA